MLKNKPLFAIILLSIVALQSCTSISYNINYSVNNQPLSETKEPIQIRIGKNDTLPEYQDNLLAIIWRLDRDELHFKISNRSEQPFKIIWDECTFYESKDNTVCRILHKGSDNIVDYFRIKGSQVPTVVTANSNYIDYILPMSHVEVDLDDGETDIEPIFYTHIKNGRLKRYTENMKNYTYTIYIPIITDDVRHDYTFKIMIESVVPIK